MSTAMMQAPHKKSASPKKKRILVLISEGGGGHKMAGESLKDIFSSEYDVDIVNAFTQVIHPLDWLNSITSGVFTSEDFYNFMLKKGYHKGVHVFATLGNKYMHANRKRIEKLVGKYLSKLSTSYDLVISTIPFINSGIAVALQKKEIPFLILPTDLDTSTFFIGMSAKQFKPEDKIAFALPYDDIDLRKKGLKNKAIPSNKVVVTGFPVRGECQKRYSEEQVKLLQLKHGIFEKYLSLTLILGASGNRMLLKYTQELAKLSQQDFKQPLQFNICTGKNEKIRLAILDWLLKEGGSVLRETSFFTTIELKNGLMFHLRKFTKDLIEIMVCSDLIITKTGSCSVNEAIYLGKKLLLDNTDTSSARYLFWETFNLHFVRKHGLGDVFYKLPEMTTLIRVLLQEDLGHPVLSGAFPVPDFRENVSKVVKELLESNVLEAVL
jgi:UDP-N-acetylglucosamine:LPS N-acetylglucosamine transferase